MREEYIDLMEKTLAAYTDKHIFHYFNKVQKDGLTEHGFPRLTANIGILLPADSSCRIDATIMKIFKIKRQYASEPSFIN